MKPAIAALANNATITSITTRYFFPHTTTADKKNGKEGWASTEAEQFVTACRTSGLEAKFTYYGEDGTGVAITERTQL